MASKVTDNQYGRLSVMGKSQIKSQVQITNHLQKWFKSMSKSQIISSNHKSFEAKIKSSHKSFLSQLAFFKNV